MKTANATRLAQLDADVRDAQENLGETEVRDLMKARAEYLARIGAKVRERGGE